MLLCLCLKTESTENSHKLKIQGIKTIYLISRSFLSIFSKLKIIKDWLPLITITIEAWKWLLLLLKPKWYLDIKLVAFQQFSSNGNHSQWVLFDLESFLLISGISEFSFFAIEHIRKPRNHGKFLWAHFSWYLFDLEYFSKYFVWSEVNSQRVAQSYQGELTIEARR